MDIRLKQLPFEFDGKTYMLRCNMIVLADVQEAYGGDLSAALDDKSALHSVLTFLAAMLNDYADEMGWDEHWSSRSVGRRLSIKDIPSAEIMQLVIAAIKGDSSEENEKN